MSIHQQTQINQYQLTLLYVKMKIKFPCKMRLQHCGNTITDQISSNDQNKFVFNQDVIIKEQADKHFLQININLITEKGSKYVSGLLKLDIDDLTRSEGEKIIAPLTKCLDSEAFCELKVSKVKSGKLSKRVSVSSTLIQINKDVIGNNFIQNAHQKLVLSPKAKKSLIVQTRSQFGFENNNLQHKVELLNDTINAMKRENQQLKRLSLQRTQADQFLIKQLRFQLDSLKVKFQNVTTQTQDIIRQKNQQILSLSSQIKLKVQQIEGQKNQIQKLQSHIHSKLYQLQKTLQAQKNNSTSKVNELRSKIQQLQRQKKSIQIDLTQSKNQRQKMKGLVLKVEYDKKVLVEEQKALRTQLLQLKSVKQKNSELNRQLLFFQDDKKNLQKQLQSTVQSKQINLQQITEQYQTKINYYKKQLKQLQEKSKIISSKIIQVQSQLEVGKNFQQKQKRIIDSQGSEITDLKNKQKQLKNYSASLQHQNLSLQNQISSSSNKLKYSQQTNRIQVQKFKEVLQKTKNELASQNLKCLQLFESKSNLQMELGKNKIQLQYSQQKIDKISTINKQLSSKIDHMTKQHETSIKQFQQILQRHQKRQKQHNEKMHASELQKINTTETIQTLKKELKINQEKINHLQSNLKSKQEDHLSIQSSLRQLQKKSLQQNMQFSTLRHDHNILKNQKHKLEKILQLKNVDIQDRKKQIKKFEIQKGKLQNIQLELRERIKKQNQSHVKTQMRLKTVEKQFQKFREVLFSTIKTEYAKIPVLERKQENSPVSSKSLQILKDQIPFTNIILSTLVNNVGDSRLTVNKLIQHNKQLKKQIQRLSQQSQQTNNKFQFSSLQFHRDIQQLEEQLQIVYNQKQEQIINYDNIVSDLNCKLYEKDNLISQLNLQCEQLQYALSSLKLDFQTNNDQNDKKVSTLKSTIHELQEKIQYINMNLANQQDRNQQLQDKLQILKTQKSQSFDSLTKKIVQIQNLQSIKIKYQSQLYQLKQQRKQLRQSISQLQIALSTQKELLQINKQILNNQQKKNQELKEFQSTLMKEKQAIIKIELEKSEQLLQSQTQLIQLKLDYQILSEDHFRQKAQSEQFKQLSKKQSSIIKSKQQELSQQTNKSLKLLEKLKQKQKQLLMKQEVISRLDIKYRELAQSNYKSSLALHDQLDSKYQQNINITSQLNQKITLLQAQVVELQHMKTKQHHEYVMQSDELLAEKQHIQLLKRQIKRLEEELQQSCEQCKSQEFKSQQLNKQIKDRQEEACQLNNQIVVLQGELQALAKDKSRRLQQLNKQWQIKYQNMLQQEQQKVQILEKQREYLRERFSQKESQLSIAIHQTKSIQTSLVDIKKNYEQKVKKLQSDRLTTILQKNNQLKKLQNQNKSLVQSSRVLQNSVQQLNQILQTTKQKLLGQQRKYTQLQQKQKTLKKLHQSQIQSLNRKQSLYKSYKQTLNQLLYSNQRQVRKVLQNYIKKIMDVCEANKVDQIAKVSKGLQTAIATAMMAKLELTK